MNHLFNGSPEEQGQGVSEMLEKELAKPYKKRDYDKIEELLNEYTRMNGIEEQIQKASEIGIQRAIAKTKTEKLRVRKCRPLLAVVCLAIVMAILNTISVVAFDMNAFSFIVHVADGGFSVDFFSKEVPSESVIQIPVSEDDPYGMIAECAKNGIYPETPHYLPEGFALENIEIFDRDVAKRLAFNYRRNNEFIVIYYTELYDFNFKSGIPSDHFNLEKIQVNGKSAIISKEDGQFTLIYYDNNMEYVIATNHLDYNECDKIVASIKK